MKTEENILFTKGFKAGKDSRDVEVEQLRSRLSGALSALKDFRYYVPQKDWKPYWQEVLDVNNV